MDPSSKAGATIAEPVADDRSEGNEDDGRERFWQAVERIGARNANEDPDEVLRFVTEVVEEVRQERYERARSATDGR